jgi:hypothetical protein
MIKNYVKYTLLETIYSSVVIIYLISLDMLNNELKGQFFNNAFELLIYSKSTPILYFGFALGLFLTGLIILNYRIKQFRHKGIVLQNVIAMIVIIVLLVLIVVFIDNPIFRAVLSVVFMSGVILSVMSS